MASFSTEIWTPGLTPNPSQQGRRELVMAANKTSKKSGGFRITTKKNSTHSSSSVFHPEDAESGAESDGEGKPTTPSTSAIPQIRTPQSATTPSPQQPKKSGFMYRIFHPHDEPNGLFGTSRRSYHSSEDDSDDCADSSDAESEKGHRSNIPKVRQNKLFRKDSDASRNSDSSRSSISSNGSDESGSDSEEKRRPNRGSIFKELMKISRGSSSEASGSEDDSDGTSRLKGLSVRKREDWKLDSLPGSPTISRTSSETSLSEKYGKKEEVLGRGANAIVRLCHPMNSDKKYAIKEFRKRKANETQKEYVKKLVAEFCISSTLEHENVVKTVDLIQDEKKQWCVVMEFCAGGDLYSRVHSGTLTDPDEINCYFKQLLLGVKYLHDMGVAHRDLKPENLLLSNDGKVLKITDFGVSEVFRTPFCNATKKASGLCGSGPYIAPEEFEKTEYSSEAVDVWACGIIYYVLAFQSIPWRAATMTDTRFKYFVEHHGQFWPFDRLVPGMRKLMYRVLEPNPDKRATVEDILADSFMKKVCVCSKEDCSNKHTHIVVAK